MTQPQGDLQPREVARRYAVLAEIGRGGMGVVWRAEDRVIGRQVALKELRLPEGLPSEERGVFEERVLREARAAGRLNDPAVVTVYDLVSDEGITYLVMELIEAPTLAELVAAQGPLPANQVAKLAAQVLPALESAHAAGIVHRDVKPSNIMVLPSGRVKLTDFGIAQAADDPRLTTTGALIGSPTYMAPERIRESAATPASDMWSLGATLFFAVEGRQPFERPTTAATMHAIMYDVPYLTKCQGPLASVIMGLLINSADARLTAQQVRSLLDLVPTQQMQTLPVPNQTVPNQTQPNQTGPNQTRQALGPGYPTQPHDSPTNVMPAPPRRWRSKIITAAIALAAVVAAFFGGMLTNKSISSGTSVERPANATRTWTYGLDGDLPEFSLSNRACAAGRLEAGRSFPSSTSCDQSHDIEVFAEDSYYQGVTYLGVTDLSRYGEAFCGMIFARVNAYAGPGKDKLNFATLIPSEKAWTTQTGDIGRVSRDIYCVLFNKDFSQLHQSQVKAPS